MIGLTLVISACASAPPTSSPIDPACRFPEGATVAWSGRSSLRALGLDRNLPPDPGGGAGPDVVTMIWVTEEPIQIYLGPSPAQPPFAPVRAFCAAYPPLAGSGQSSPAVVCGHLPEGWEPPN